MRNLKTDKGYKVVIDYVDRYYTWNELREYFALDEEGFYIAFLGGREFHDIDDLQIGSEGINWLLWRDSEIGIPKENLPWWDKHESEEDYKENEEYYIERYGDYEKEYEIRPFYISYYGNGEYRVQFCEASEAQGMMLIKRRPEGQAAAEDLGKKVFERYIEGGFFYTQIYSPHKAEFIEENFKKDHNVTYYDYEDGGIFFLTEEEAIESLPEYCGKILPKTESYNFDSFELNSLENSDQSPDNQ